MSSPAEQSTYGRVRERISKTPGLGERSLQRISEVETTELQIIPRRQEIRIEYDAYRLAESFIGQPPLAKDQRQPERHVLLVLEREDQRLERRRDSVPYLFYSNYLHEVTSEVVEAQQLNPPPQGYDLIIYVGKSTSIVSPDLFPNTVKLQIVESPEEQEYYAPQGVSDEVKAKMRTTAENWNKLQKSFDPTYKDKKIEEILYNLYPYHTFTDPTKIATLEKVEEELNLGSSAEARLWLTACGIPVIKKEETRERAAETRKTRLSEKNKELRRQEAIRRWSIGANEPKFKETDSIIKLAFGPYYEDMIGLSDREAARRAGVNHKAITLRRKLIEQHLNYKKVASGRELLAAVQRHNINIEQVLRTPIAGASFKDVERAMDFIYKRFHQMLEYRDIAKEYQSKRREANITMQGVQWLVNRAMERIDTALLVVIISKKTVSNEDGNILLRYANALGIDLHTIFPKRKADEIDRTIAVLTDHYQNVINNAVLAKTYNFPSEHVVTTFINKSLMQVKIAVGEAFQKNQRVLLKHFPQ